MEVVLDDNRVFEYIKIDIPKSLASDAQHMTQWKKDTAKVRRMILEGVRDHIVPKFHGNETPFHMWKNLSDMFERNSNDQKHCLNKKFRNIQIGKDEPIVTYLSRFDQVRDELGSVGETVPLA